MQLPAAAAAAPHLVLHIAQCHQRQHLIDCCLHLTRACTQVHTLAPGCTPAAAAAAADALSTSHACAAATAAAQLQQVAAAAAGAL